MESNIATSLLQLLQHSRMLWQSKYIVLACKISVIDMHSKKVKVIGSMSNQSNSSCDRNAGHFIFSSDTKSFIFLLMVCKMEFPSLSSFLTNFFMGTSILVTSLKIFNSRIWFLHAIHYAFHHQRAQLPGDTVWVFLQTAWLCSQNQKSFLNTLHLV